MFARLDRLRSAPWGEAMLLAAIALCVGAISLYPLAALLMEAFRPVHGGGITDLLLSSWSSRSVIRAFNNTLAVAVVSSLVSLVYGAVAAFAIRLTPIRGKVALTFIFLLPMLIPSQITALAWIELMGPSSPILRPFGLAPEAGRTNPLYSFYGIVWVMGIEHGGLVLIAALAGLKAIPRDLIEAARVAGAKTGHTIGHIILPLVAPSLAAGVLLAFVSSIGNFGVPALLGIPGRYTVLTTLIYQRLNGFGPSVFGEVAAIALILVLLAAVGLLLEYWLGRALMSRLDRTGASLGVFSMGRWQNGVTAAIWMLALLLAVLPLAALILSSLTPAIGVALSAQSVTFDHYGGLLLRQQSMLRAIGNSLLLAFTSALACALIAVVIAYLGRLRRWRVAEALDACASLPYAAPGTVLALAIIIAFLPPLPLIGLSLYGTLGIIFIAYVARFLPLALRPAVAAMGSIDPALDEAGAMAGAAPIRRLVAIILPMAAPAAIAGAVMVFMTAINELTVSALLTSTGTETIGVSIFALQYEGNSPQAAALSVVSIVITLVMALVVDRLARRNPALMVPWR